MVQTFWPVTFQAPFDFTARVLSEARSEPDSGSREALAPDLLAREDRLQEALLLLVGAVGDHDRAAHDQAQHVGGRGHPLAGQLLVEDRLLDQRRALAAELLGPGESRPAGIVHLLLPGAAELELGLDRRPRGRGPGWFSSSQLAHLVAEGGLGLGQRQVHAAEPNDPG